MSALAVGGLATTLCVRRVGGWRGLLLRTLLAYGFGSFAFASGVATISGFGASRALGWADWLAIHVELARRGGPLVQGALRASGKALLPTRVAARALHGILIQTPVRIQDVVSGQKLN